MRRSFVATTLLLTASALAGCGSSTDVQPAPELRVGRYQFIGKQVYPDGTIEYSCLDTATGSIGYATIYPDADKERRSLTDFNCSN